MGSSTSWIREERSHEFICDLHASGVVALVDIIFWWWTSGGSAINDLERISLRLFDHATFSAIVLVLLRQIARGVARRFPDRLLFSHRLAALSNRTALFGVLPLVAAAGVLLTLCPFGPPHMAWWVWAVQFGLIFGVAGVQTWCNGSFLSKDFNVRVRNSDADPGSGAMGPSTESPASETAPVPGTDANEDVPPPEFRHSPDKLGSLAVLSGIALLACIGVVAGEAMLAPYLPWVTVPLKTYPGYPQTYWLPDGNTLSIYPGSAIRVRYSLTRREVEIDRGGALVNVCACNRRTQEFFSPELRMRAGAAVVTVEGPRGPGETPQNEFFIHRLGEKTEVMGDMGNGVVLNTSVTVASGSAAFRAGTTQHLKEQDLAIVTPYHTEVRAMTHQESVNRLAWMHGALSFSDTPLQEVVEEVNQVAERHLEIADPVIATVPVTGDFRLIELPNLAERVVVVLERDGKVRRTPKQQSDDPIQLVAYDADPVRYGPVEVQVGADLCASYRGAHDRSSYGYNPTEANPEMDLNLAGCDVPTALAGFSQQTGFEYEMVTAPTSSAVTHPIKGVYSVQDALATMLNGTGCRATGDVHSGLKIACTQS